MKQKILIGSCGGLVGSYLGRKYRERFIVYGYDISEQVGSKYFLDKLFLLPRFNEAHFLDALLHLLCEEAIEYYIPTNSKEIRVISEHEETIRKKWAGKFVVSPYSTCFALENKETAHDELTKLGIPVPKKITEDTTISYPIISKRNIGSGGVGVRILENEHFYRGMKALGEDACFYELVQGKEITVDCFFDTEGTLVSYAQRVRVKNIGGAVLITESFEEFDILPYIQKISGSFTMKGCVNFQYILKDNVPYFIDINLRFASGGLPLTVERGIDIPNLLIDLLDSKKIEPFELDKKQGKKVMYRYFEELYEDIN